MSEPAKVTIVVACECGYIETHDTQKRGSYVESLDVTIDYPGDEDEQASLMFNCPQCKKEVRISV